MGKDLRLLVVESRQSPERRQVRLFLSLLLLAGRRFNSSNSRMHQGFEPKLTDTNVSSLVAPGGASVDSILADEAKKEKEEEPENA